MPELLLELGCEELPASFVRKAYIDLQALVEQQLAEAGLEFRRTEEPIGTPRRLIIHLVELPDRQPDRTKEQRGPALKAAYDASGAPTPALQGFCRSQGVDVSDLRTEGNYVWATKTVVGLPTIEVLAQAVPAAIRNLSFEKSMRWGAGKMRFARPIRWILACFDGKGIEFEVEGVHAGLLSRGHRFESPDEFTARTRNDLLRELRSRRVEADPSIREQWVRERAGASSSGEPLLSDALVEENVFLTEWPFAHEGSFKPDYLDLPRPVLVTAMAKHERFFPVQSADGKLLPKFVSIRNGGDEETVRKGNEWVLNARFNDAKFFFDEDARQSMADFLEKTRGILFQEKLGSVRQRSDRLAGLAAAIAQATGANEEEIEFARQAGLYCKADLSTGLVSELPALQGLIGGEYARREGFPDPVCWAIASHYDLEKNPNPDCPGGRTAMRVLIADQLDKLGGYLGLGLAPSGSSDPFGLRRAATMLIEAAWGWREPDVDALDYGTRIGEALNEFVKQSLSVEISKVGTVLEDIFASRYEALLIEVRHDILDAATCRGALNPRAVKLRIATLELFAGETAFVFTATRPINIVSAARQKGIAVPDEVDLHSLNADSLGADGVRLRDMVAALQPCLNEAARGEDANALAAKLRSLNAPINAFFESTMIMVEDSKMRDTRLALLQAVSRALFMAGDFSKLVIEG